MILTNAQFALNLADDEVLMGASHNVFVGKVDGQIGIKNASLSSRVTIPITQFTVNVVANIKGNLDGSVTINQAGGYKGGVLYTIDGGYALESDVGSGDYLLRPGNTYLFATRYDNEAYDLWSFPSALTLISQANTLTTNQL